MVSQSGYLAYNLHVPTPFYHLSIARELISHPALPEALRNFLVVYKGAFLFGNTAPDVQVVSGQFRESTHFFELPINPGVMPAWERVLEEHPTLADTVSLDPARLAFMAGYMCHLQADWYWVLHIYAPIFGPAGRWGTYSHRSYLHNVLRSYLDRQILSGVQNGTASKLMEANPSHWLPFVNDHHLFVWRDLLSEQLLPGAMIRTVEVFATRQGLSPDAYYSLLDSEIRMEQEVFSHLPRQTLDQYRDALLTSNLALLSKYLDHHQSQEGA